MGHLDRAPDPGRRGQLLLLDGEPAGVLLWVHDAVDRSATGWYLQLLDADGEPAGQPHRLPDPDDVAALRASDERDRGTWIRQAETVELVSASAALRLAEAALEELRRRHG
jgi:hypothetical protein